MKPLDLTGQRFGRLTALDEAPPHVSRSRPHRRYTCECDCGNLVVVTVNHLRRKNTQSCGCLDREKARKRLLKHGYAGSRGLYAVWLSMRSRCNNPQSASYKNYGGRGITVCKRWESFENFRLDMGERPKGLSIERIDNNGNYEPGNCKWATRREQANNNRNNILVEWRGVKYSAADFCRKHHFPYDRFRYALTQKRLSLGEIVSKFQKEQIQERVR